MIEGYRLQALGMTPMAVQIIGTILNKCVSTGDGRWGLPWGRISSPMKVYAIGDIKFGHLAYQILAGVLLRDVFPDPDVVCSLLGCFQKDGVAWFSELLMDSARETEVDGEAIKSAESRKVWLH